jgi:hypothetical protein
MDGFGPRCEEASSRLAEAGIVESDFAREVRRYFGTRVLVVRYRTGELGDASAFVHRTVELGLRRFAFVGGDDPVDAQLLAERFVFLEREIPDVPWLTWSGSVELLLLSKSDASLPSWCLGVPADAVRIVLVPEGFPDPERPDRALVEMRDAWTLGSVSSVMRTWRF